MQTSALTPAEVKDVYSLFVLLNSCGLLAIVFWAGKLTNRLETLEKNEQNRTSQATDIAVIKSEFAGLRQDFAEMKQDLHEMRDSWGTFQTSVLHKKLTSGD